MLPEKHPTVLNAHTRFEEVNAAFVRVTDSVSGSHCLKYFTILDHQLLQEWRGSDRPAPPGGNISQSFSNHIRSSAGLSLNLEEGYQDDEP